MVELSVPKKHHCIQGERIAKLEEANDNMTGWQKSQNGTLGTLCEDVGDLKVQVAKQGASTRNYLVVLIGAVAVDFVTSGRLSDWVGNVLKFITP